ncbi:MAG: hypothetical protein IT420_01590 [Candidatus Brocadia sp.]|nr:hypothetical protein [Candidatus Brocadia sp.]
MKNNLDSNHRVNSVFGLLIQAATGALGGLGGISLNVQGDFQRRFLRQDFVLSQFEVLLPISLQKLV